MIGDSGDAVTFSAILNGCDMKTLRKKIRAVRTVCHTFTLIRWSQHIQNRDTDGTQLTEVRICVGTAMLSISPPNVWQTSDHPRVSFSGRLTPLSSVSCLEKLTGVLSTIYHCFFLKTGFTEKAVQKHTYTQIYVCVSTLKIPATITDASSCSFPLVILQEMTAQMERGSPLVCPMGGLRTPSPPCSTAPPSLSFGRQGHFNKRVLTRGLRYKYCSKGIDGRVSAHIRRDVLVAVLFQATIHSNHFKEENQRCNQILLEERKKKSPNVSANGY